MAAAKGGGTKKNETFTDKSKDKDVRTSNIIAAKAVADAIRTSLGPRGMDKMIQNDKGEVIITNDGATILAQMQVFHPTARMLVDLSHAQDVEAGDGTTSVTVIAGALLESCQKLLSKGIHPTAISEAFGTALNKSIEILEDKAIALDLSERENLIKAATTSLSSKVISHNSSLLAPMAVDAVLRVIDPKTADNVDLNDIKIVKQLGGTIDDTELVDGLVFTQNASAKGPKIAKDAKIGLIQFCLSAPKTDMENNIVISEFAAMDRLLREERKYILKMCKAIKKAGCTVLLIQKSIIRDAYNDLSLHFLAKLGIMVVTDIERSDIEFISRTLGCKPVAHIDSFTSDKLGKAGLVEEVAIEGSRSKVVKITEVPKGGKTVTVLCRGSNKLVIDESERSLHDALCVIRSLVKKKFLIAGGGAPEMELSVHLGRYCKTLKGVESYCLAAYAEALEIIPYTLAENAGMHPIAIVTELRRRHAEGDTTCGINVNKGIISNIVDENVLQPLLVNTSALTLATECVRMILKIDDLVATL